MQIKNPELKELMDKLADDERRIAELFAQALGEDHVLNTIKKNRDCFFIDSKKKNRIN